ncbi:MAG: sugar-binding transcriptional regulator [Janthinobacterium lividum]
MAAREDDLARRELLASVASMYYLEGLDQNAIAASVGLSRSSVSRLITEARQSGVVHIRVDRPMPRAADLEERLTAAFPLTEAVVLADAAAAVITPTVERIGALAAHHVHQCFPAKGTLAISWGETVAAVAAALPHDPSREARVVQMIGASGTARPEIDGPGVARTFASRLGGQHRTLNAPLVVDSAELARALVRQPPIAQVLQDAAAADMALIGLGSMEPGSSSLVRAGYVEPHELAQCAALGIVGDVAGHMLDSRGDVTASDLGDRMVTLDEASLRGIPAVVVVAYGPSKVKIIEAALRGGFLDVLITDAETVRTVLENSARTTPGGRR